jgi:DNA-binding PadR family transcriptional regulator
MRRVVISKLGYALLGLLWANPASGYDLRKIFSRTAMTTYSDSPGAIYPALGRLQEQGLIRGSIESGAGLRRRRVFTLTALGASELKKWISRPLTQGDIIRGLDEVMLRFAFSEPAAGKQVSVGLLESLKAELTSYLPNLHQQRAAGKATMPTSGSLALESGIRSYETLLQWTKDALAIYGRQKHAGQQDLGQQHAQKGHVRQENRKGDKTS